MQPQPIAVYNRATEPLGVDLDALVAALQVYVDQYVGPAWHVSAHLSRSAGPVSGAWGLVFLDDADAEGALAYHDEETGLPVAKVFVRTVLEAKASLSVAASHELVEMLVDPLCNLYAQAPDGTTLYALESADAVEDDSLGFMIDSFLMSDFVYPAWFDAAPAPGVRQFDHQNVITAPFQLHSGGYAITMAGGDMRQVFASTMKARAFAQEDRRGRRGDYRRMRIKGVRP